MNSRNILSLLGLAKRAGKLAVGEEPAEAAARAKDARLLLLAADAAEGTRRRIERFAQAGDCLWLRLPFPKDDLGRALGRTSVAIAAVTDVGLAAAVASRLSELDGAQYADAAQRLELKARRAAERKAEQVSHEKNLRRGKRRPKAPPPPPPAEESPPPPAARAPKPAAPRRPAGPGRPAVLRSAGPGAPRKGGPGRPSGPRKDEPRTQGAAGPHRAGPGKGGPRTGSRPSKDKRPRPKAAANPYAHSRPVKKGKGSFRKREG